MKEIIGYILISLPFLAIFIISMYYSSLLDTLIAFGLAISVVLIISIGVYLIS